MRVRLHKGLVARGLMALGGLVEPAVVCVGPDELERGGRYDYGTKK